MRRPVAAAFLAVLLVLSASPVAAHGNHVEVDSQHSTDGTVVVEAVRPLTDGFLVLHRETDDGDFGEPVGNVPISSDDGFQRHVPVQMNDDAWVDWPDNDTVWVVFHADENANDGGFDPEVDTATSAFGSVTGRAVTLAKTDQPARVLAERSAPQQTTTPEATVSEVTLPADGFLVLRTDGADGPVVGSQALDAGVHENVTVPVDNATALENEAMVGFYAQAYTDDGDGEFTSDDELVRAGDSPVSSYFLVWYTEDASTTTSDPIVQTPGTDEDVATPTGTTKPTETTTQTTDATTSGESSSSVPGFGVVHAMVAVLVAVGILARRR